MYIENAQSVRHIVIGENRMSKYGISAAQEEVANMMAAFDQQVRFSPEDPPLTEEERKLRWQLIAEEAEELLEAIEKNDVVEGADGIADLIVVALGTASAYGIDMGQIWDEVMQTNMAKTEGPKDPVTGKQLKPEGWQPPNIRNILEEQGWNPKND